VTERNDDLEARVLAAKRLIAVREARDSFKAFMRFMMPDTEFPDDPAKTAYDDTPQGNLLCQVIEETEAGKRMRTAVSMPPQHGKTIHLSTLGPAWIAGRNPHEPIILACYNDTRSAEIGEMFLQVVNSTQFKQVFPDFRLVKGSQSKTSMLTTKGGRIVFAGLRGSITGRTARYFIIDDPIKDDVDAQSELLREQNWKKFFAVAFSRGGNKTRMIVLHTRWHEDDLIGRLVDPDHPERGKRFKHDISKWDYWNLPGVVTDPKLAKALGLKLEQPTDPAVIEQFGDVPMAALYAKEKDLSFFAEWRAGDSASFDALVMGKPSPDDGDYFKAEYLVEYDLADLPPRADLRMYGASDHAVSVKQGRDYTVIGCVGVDKDDNIWIMPDVAWRQMETDKTVEELIRQFKLHKPQLWWLESELISKSFGPFLRKRMRETNTYVTIDPVTPSPDKKTRARSIQGRMSMGMVRFPRFAPWYKDARQQLLKFDRAAKDDFVDFIAHVGQGLDKEYGPAKRRPANDNPHPTGSIGWILANTKARVGAERRAAANKGW
jgi:predicted phage terminase large subunit-like protein